MESQTVANITEASAPTEDGLATPHAEQTCPFSGASSGSCPVHPVTEALPSAQALPSDSILEVDPELLRTSLPDRVVYLTDFLNFGRAEQAVINKVAPLVHDMIPGVVDDLYAKLFEFDITKKIFLVRNQGFDGPLPEKLEDLTLDSAQITYRKIFMKSWARRVLTSDYSNGKTWAYMDKVGIMHTGVVSFKQGNRKPLNVPYRDCALTLGWVLTVLQTAILQLEETVLPISEKIQAVAAINKIIWIQNDLFSRHYIDE